MSRFTARQLCTKRQLDVMMNSHETVDMVRTRQDGTRDMFLVITTVSPCYLHWLFALLNRVRYELVRIEHHREGMWTHATYISHSTLPSAHWREWQPGWETRLPKAS